MDYLVEWMNDRHITIRSDSVAASVIETAVANPNPTIVSTLPEEDGVSVRKRIRFGVNVTEASDGPRGTMMKRDVP